MSLSASLRMQLAATLTAVQDLGNPSAPKNASKTSKWSDGTAVGQANLIFADTRTLAASATEDLDLAGVLTDPLGTTLTFARVKGLYVAAAAANTNTVVMSRPAANGLASLFSAASDAIILRPGAWMALAVGDADATGYAVTAGTADLLTFTNGGAGTSVTYDVVIIGASA